MSSAWYALAKVRYRRRGRRSEGGQGRAVFIGKFKAKADDNRALDQKKASGENGEC
jgi:hypothetical protein